MLILAKQLGGLRGGYNVKTTHEDVTLEYHFQTVDSAPSNLADKQVSLTATMIERWLITNREVMANGTQRIA